MKYKSDKSIFISYYDQQILSEIKTVFGALEELDREIGNLKTVERKQSNNLETINARINEIRSQCSSAIICLPLENLEEESIREVAYFDLGACLARFPERTLLIHQGNKIPEDLASNVEVFQYHGNLGFKTGMELARKILKVLKKD